MAGWLARSALAAGVAGAVLAVGAPAAHAAPANTEVVRTVEQPDGSTLRVRLWGDEFLHGYETLSGYTVAYDRGQRRYEFAERTRSGGLRPAGPSATRSRRPDVRKHLRPTRAAWERARRDAGSPSFGALAASAAAPAWAGADTDVLFLAAEFTDTGCSFDPGEHEANMFGATSSGPGNLTEYFEEISYGALDLVGTVVGNAAGDDCIALANDRDYYNTGAANRDDDLVREAVLAADAYVDFADYDNDGDGTVDALGIIYAGGGPHDGCSLDAPPSGGDGDNLWPHSGGVNTGGALTADGKTILPFIINSETTFSMADTSTCDQIQTIGLFAHELGHSLGLPDLYDTDVGNGGVHTWSTMASQYVSTVNLADTPPHYDPWSKAMLGWVTPVVHQPGDRFNQSIPQVETSGEVHQFRDNPDGFEQGGTGEYWLVENRQQTLFDQGLPGCGLLVWHIDEAQTGNQNGGHTAASHRLVDVDEADGLAELDANGRADAGDPFPGSTNNLLFDDATNPASDLYDGTASGVRMRVRTTTCEPDMLAAFGPNQPPTADAGGPYSTDEGTDAALSATGSTDPEGDALTYAWDLDDDGVHDDSTSATPSFTDVGDDDVHTVSVRVTDAYGETDTDTATVTVDNVAPTVGVIAQDGPKPENTTLAISALVSDPGWEDDLSATVDWGDGEAAEPVGGTEENVRPDATLAVDESHVYGDEGTFVVTVCATDDDATSSPCSSVEVTIDNVLPTAEIDESGTVLINGVPTVLAVAGVPEAFTGTSTDPGSEDLALSWSWDDGSPDTATTFLLAPPGTDPFPSPSIAPREITDTQDHTFTACLYDVGFTADDDDGGTSPTDTVKVLVTGAADKGRQSGYWAHQYRQDGKSDFSGAILACYLEIAGYASTVFDEARDASTFDAAQKVLFSQGDPVTKRDQLDRDLLTAWLNFANGAVAWDELVSSTGKKPADAPFHATMATAEAVRLDPASTPKQIDAQRQIISHINSSV